MIHWSPFTYGGDTYDLSHLHPCQQVFVQPATKDKPAREYHVQVIYSLHCFTRSIKPGEKLDSLMLYSDKREKRVFDFRRYALSTQLPGIVGKLLDRSCYHSGKGNFFVVELVDEAGQQVDYEIYFEATKSSMRGVVNLFVQSAYVRDQQHAGNRPRLKTIRFQIILFNVLNGKPIRIPK